MRMQDMTEPQLAALLRECAKAVKAVLHCVEGTPLFVVLVFNDTQAAQYISTCVREDTIKAMREVADRLETETNIHPIDLPGDPRQN